MSLLCITVRRARLVGVGGPYNSYVTLKLQNVKSTTVAVKGNNPSWEQDFIFETNCVDTGMIIEVWAKGMLWDKLIGSQWFPLMSVQYSKEVGQGQWLSLDAELVMNDGDIIGTKTPTGHSILIEAHFELPFDLEGTNSPELQHKLEILNRLMDEKLEAVREHQPHQLNSCVSEDSDYTSDVGYSANQHPSASVDYPKYLASHFGGASNLSNRTFQYDELLVDQDTSFELDHCNEKIYDDKVYHPKDGDAWMKESDSDSELMYYNSRPPEKYLERERSSYVTQWCGKFGYSNSLEYESDQSFSFDTNDQLMYHDCENRYDGEVIEVTPSLPEDLDIRSSLEQQKVFDQKMLNDMYEPSQNNCQQDSNTPDSDLDIRSSLEPEEEFDQKMLNDMYESSQNDCQQDSNTPDSDLGIRSSMEQRQKFDQKMLNDMYESSEKDCQQDSNTPGSMDAYKQDSADSTEKWQEVMHNLCQLSWDPEIQSFETEESDSPSQEQWSSVEQPSIPEQFYERTEDQLVKPDEVSLEHEEKKEQDVINQLSFIETDTRTDREIMSKPKDLWLTAFNKIISQLNEVLIFFRLCCMCKFAEALGILVFDTLGVKVLKILSRLCLKCLRRPCP
ncbi:phorbol ester/diacylglycerol-binding protein unc-13-like [Limulus polyphemus]|uniref:Phorbol ester/diacylglycerol-binding protein unc-13-like n=1 Tax=Limulus polyphemus TaxID=6850 RepID=A0ABM1SV79_LIMPO|nr:phorbol ester/diacylglycerol-binding protein unc-13-like [Limulus polyphemus]